MIVMNIVIIIIIISSSSSICIIVTTVTTTIKPLLLNCQSARSLRKERVGQIAHQQRPAIPNLLGRAHGEETLYIYIYTHILYV